jgi:hypothetical protein
MDILVGLLGRVISPTHGLCLHRTTQHRKTWTHIHASSGIRTCDPSVRAVEGSTFLRTLGLWERLFLTYNGIYLLFHAAPFEIVPLRFYTVIPGFAPLLKTNAEIPCFELDNCDLWLYLNRDDVVKSSSLHFQYGFTGTSHKQSNYRLSGTAQQAKYVRSQG